MLRIKMGIVRKTVILIALILTVIVVALFFHLRFFILEDDAAIVAEKILETFKKKFILGDHKLSTGISMGISFYPDDGADSDTLFRKADAALYQVKKSGGSNYKYFTS